jgi:hypothetical protein
MASPFAGVFLAYMLSVSFTDSLSLNISSVDKLVDYSYNFPSSGMIPSLAYNGSIGVRWVVPDSALAGLEGKSLFVRITAKSSDPGTVFFPAQYGISTDSSEAYLHCDVSGGACANSSVLFAKIPFTMQSSSGASAVNNLTLKSELVEDAQSAAISQSAGGILESIQGMLSGNRTPAADSGNGSAANKSAHQQNGNFLDSLKPEGDSQDPIAFLKENPVISLAALAIVIVITGAYLLNAND